MIDIAQIKKGERYKLELLCILNANQVLVFETPSGDHIPIRNCDIESISPAEPKSNRRPHVGDKMRIVDWNGSPAVPMDEGMNWDGYDDGSERLCYIRAIRKDGRIIVTQGEKDDMETESACFAPCFLELVEAMEERKPFFVFEDATSWQVKKGKSLCARYGKATHPRAKEAAEDEAERLNEEWQTKQSEK